MLNQIETITDFSEDFTEGKRYSILSYVDVNLGHNPYNFYAKQLVKLDNIIFMGQTNQFFKTNKGRIKEMKIQELNLTKKFNLNKEEDITNIYDANHKFSEKAFRTLRSMKRK